MTSESSTVGLIRADAANTRKLPVLVKLSRVRARKDEQRYPTRAIVKVSPVLKGSCRYRRGQAKLAVTGLHVA